MILCITVTNIDCHCVSLTVIQSWSALPSPFVVGLAQNVVLAYMKGAFVFQGDFRFWYWGALPFILVPTYCCNLRLMSRFLPWLRHVMVLVRYRRVHAGMWYLYWVKVKGPRPASHLPVSFPDDKAFYLRLVAYPKHSYSWTMQENLFVLNFVSELFNYAEVI